MRLLLVVLGVVELAVFEVEFSEPEVLIEPEPERLPEALTSREVELFEPIPLVLEEEVPLVEGKALLARSVDAELDEEGAGAALLPIVGPAGEPKLPDVELPMLVLPAEPPEVVEDELLGVVDEVLLLLVLEVWA